MRIYRTWKSKLLKRQFLIDIQSMKFPTTETEGVSLRVVGTTQYTIGLDYDKTKDETLNEFLTYLQERYHLGDFHVLSTSEFGRHAYCVDILSLRETLDVVYDSGCDYVFKRGCWINEYRTWVLRTEPKGERPKPTYLRTIESPYNGERMQSLAHALFLEECYGIKVRLAFPDGNRIVEKQKYLTGSLTTVKELLKERGEQK